MKGLHDLDTNLKIAMKIRFITRECNPEAMARLRKYRRAVAAQTLAKKNASVEDEASKDMAKLGMRGDSGPTLNFKVAQSSRSQSISNISKSPPILNRRSKTYNEEEKSFGATLSPLQKETRALDAETISLSPDSVTSGPKTTLQIQTFSQVTYTPNYECPGNLQSKLDEALKELEMTKKKLCKAEEIINMIPDLWRETKEGLEGDGA